MKRAWTNSETEYLFDNYPDGDILKIAKKLKRTYNAIKSKAKILNIRRSVNVKKIFTHEEIEFLKENYPNIRTDIIATKLNCSVYAIYNRAFKYGLEKSKKFLNSPDSGILFPGHNRGKLTQFKKGHTPANKGKNLTPEVREKVKHTWFKKGHKPHNTKDDGCISIRNNALKKPYKWIRIKDDEWELLQRIVWEKANGIIPKGHNIVFKDGNTLNCDLQNLEMISNKELMLRNTIIRYPEEIQTSMRTLAKLNKQIEHNEK